MFTENNSTLLENKIIYGEAYAPGDKQFLAYLKLNGVHCCTTVLATRKHAIATARCVHKLVPPFYNGSLIVSGIFSLTESGATSNISNIISHPLYQHRREPIIIHDIAVIGVSNPK